MVKKGYCGNGSLGLAWDCMNVCNIYPFYTTCGTLLWLSFMELPISDFEVLSSIAII